MYQFEREEAFSEKWKKKHNYVEVYYKCCETCKFSEYEYEGAFYCNKTKLKKYKDVVDIEPLGLCDKYKKRK